MHTRVTWEPGRAYHFQLKKTPQLVEMRVINESWLCLMTLKAERNERRGHQLVSKAKETKWRRRVVSSLSTLILPMRAGELQTEKDPEEGSGVHGLKNCDGDTCRIR